MSYCVDTGTIIPKRYDVTWISQFSLSDTHTSPVFLVIKGIIIERGMCQSWCSQQPTPSMFCYPVSLKPQAWYPKMTAQVALYKRGNSPLALSSHIYLKVKSRIYWTCLIYMYNTAISLFSVLFVSHGRQKKNKKKDRTWVLSLS